MRLVPALLAIGIASAMARAQESLPIEAVGAIKDATVMIVARGGGEAGGWSSGSGFLIRSDGKSGLIVTNHHVVRPAGDDDPGKGSLRVTFRAGTRGERKVAARLAAASAERDLAVLRVDDVADLPRALDVRTPAEPVETMNVYVFGFPFGESLAAGRGRASVVVGRGSVSSVRRADDGNPTAVLIDGALNPGNSGGPVVDTKGRLVGVAVAAVQGAHIGIAIPPGELLAMLQGRAEGLEVASASLRDGSATLEVGVPLSDPLGHIKAVRLLYRPVSGDGEGTASPKDGGDPLKGAEEARLTLEGDRARGSVRVAVRPGADLVLHYQLALDEAEGKTTRSAPARYFLKAVGTADPGADGDGKNGAKGLEPWGEAIDPDGDCAIRLAPDGVRFEIGAAHHDLSTDLSKRNGPRVVREVEGDFEARVRVVGTFEPEGPPTRQDGIPFNGAGLVVWLDGDHFLRLERAAGRRDERIGTWLFLEEHEAGRPVRSHSAFVEPGGVHLKIVRRGSRITGYASADGKQWIEAEPVEVRWPGRVKVGFAAVSSSSSPLKVRFEGFSVRRLAADPPG